MVLQALREVEASVDSTLSRKGVREGDQEAGSLRNAILPNIPRNA